VTCAVIQERDQSRLYDAVSRAARTGDAFAVLDPTWPRSFLALATAQVADAVSAGVVGNGDMVVFSSGSTGRPRGITRTVESWRVSFESFSKVTGITADDTVWLPGPLWSSLFLFGACHAGAVGAKVALRDDDSSCATVLHCVPSQLPGLLHRAVAGGLPQLRLAVVAGDHLAASVRQQCQAAGVRVLEYYGAAQLSLVAWRDAGGPFRAFDCVETELRDGLLWVRSPYLATGYLSARSDSLADAPSYDTASDGPLRADPDGWVTVSDLARAVPGGLEILGRGNSAVTTGGHTVVVEEVERLLREVPGVDEVAVLGMAHPRLGQVLAAVVVGPAQDASLREAVAVMPAPSRPRRWLHADALPRTSGGKVRREALPDLVAGLQRR
jgi:acyl-CoA synthetase (AMP-forming)/AMP-acid ligase II